MEELVVAKRARAEDATPVVAYRRPMDSLDDAYLSAEERADRIEREFKAVAPIVAMLTPHLYKVDRAQFDRQDRVLEEALCRVDAMVIGLRMAAESEYAPTPWHVRLLLWAFSFIGAAQKVRQTLVKARRRHEARMQAADQYEELASGYAQYVEDIRNEQITIRVGELLLSHQEYQELLAEVPVLKRKIADSEYYETKCRFRNQRTEVVERMAQLKEQVRNVVLKEFKNEDR